MKKILTLTLISILTFGCEEYMQDLEVTTCTPVINGNYSKAQEIQSVIETLVTQSIPGVAVAIYSDEGWWTSAAGVAKIENNLAMQSCHLQYLQSIAKTYMAVGILKLYEQGKIDLQAPMTNYLPEKFAR